MPLSSHANPDLLLLVDQVRDRDRTILVYDVETRDPRLGPSFARFESAPLRGDQHAYFAEIFRTIGDIGWREEEDPFADKERLQGLGIELFEELIPQELQRQLWAIHTTVHSVWIVSDEAWIPWEMMKLRDPVDSAKSGPFFAEIFSITRWLKGFRAARELPLRRIALVVTGDSQLPSASIERAALKALKSGERHVDDVPARRRKVLEGLASADYDAWHFIGHGFAVGNNPGAWYLELENGEELRAPDLAHNARRLGRTQPLIFLNICHGARGGATLTGVGGLGSAFLKAGAGAFVSAAWATSDGAATEFARAFYRHLLDGTPLGEAMRQARLSVYESFPGDPSWLAYTAFGHPLAVAGDEAAEDVTAAVAEPFEKANTRDAQEDNGSLQTGARPPRRRDPAKQRRSTVRQLTWGAAGLLVGLVSFAVLYFTPTATRIRLDLTVDRVVFQVAGTESQPLLTTKLGFRSLALNEFGRIEFAHGTNGGPATGVLTARDPAASVLLDAAESSDELLGSFGPLRAEPGARVVLQSTPSGADFDLKLELRPAAPLGIDIAKSSSFQLRPEHMEHVDIDMTSGGSGLSGERPVIDVFSGDAGLGLIATVPGSLKQRQLLEEPLVVTALEFVDQGAGGKFQTTLARDGLLSYPDHSWLGELTLHDGGFLAVEALETFHIRRIDIDPDAALHLVFEGVAAGIRAGSEGHARDYRLSLFQKVFQGPMWSWLVGWVSAAVGLALALERLWPRKGTHLTR